MTMKQHDPIEDRTHDVYSGVTPSVHPPTPQNDDGAPAPEPVPAPRDDQGQGPEVARKE